MIFSITQNGQPLGKSLYTIDLEHKVFTSTECNLILDFGNLSDWTFTTGSVCMF